MAAENTPAENIPLATYPPLFKPWGRPARNPPATGDVPTDPPLPSGGPSVPFPGILAALDASEVLRTADGPSGARERPGEAMCSKVTDGDTPVTIRPLYGPDLTPEFIEVMETLSPVGLEPHELGDVFRRRLRDGIRTYVACVDDPGRAERGERGERIVGTASLILEQRFAYGGGLAGHVADVVVHPAWQRCGIGRKLVEFVLQQAWELKCRKVVLNCAPHLEGFYAALGLVKHDIFLRADNPNL